MPAALIRIGKFIALNWEWLLSAALTAVVCVVLHNMRMDQETSKLNLEHQAQITALKDAAEKARQRIQAAADNLSTMYERQKAISAKQNEKSAKELEAYARKTPAFTDCHAGPDFMRIYQGAGKSGANAGRGRASKPH